MRRSVTILILLLISVPLVNFGYFIFRYIALGPVNDCEVGLVDVYVSHVDTDSAKIVAIVEVLNPTNKRVSVDGIRIELYAEDIYIGEYTINRTITLTPGDKVTIPINFTIYYSNVPTEFVRALLENRTGDVIWWATGGLYANSLFGTLEVPFNVTLG
ncbi:LEA type 2 family protein [Pyrococcus kukulkanii]|uniref:Late embryogenesis abundant protein LEA-2 subgroup domain-containing protein n=1 Tax=Pyrococcus kukulkanii TaxID=1609559 RepID=A0ABV4T5X2_9EURY